MELQIKSKKMKNLAYRAHKFYKRKNIPQRLITEGKRLFKLGY